MSSKKSNNVSKDNKKVIEAKVEKINENKKNNGNSSKAKIKTFAKGIPGMLKKILKCLLIVIILLTFYLALRMPRLHEGYLDGLSYQDELFCDKIVEDDSFTIQDFYFIRNYYNKGITKAEFCEKLIGVFDAQYKEYLEQENNSNETNDTNTENNSQTENK